MYIYVCACVCTYVYSLNDKSPLKSHRLTRSPVPGMGNFMNIFDTFVILMWKVELQANSFIKGRLTGNIFINVCQQ